MTKMMSMARYLFKKNLIENGSVPFNQVETINGERETKKKKKMLVLIR